MAKNLYKQYETQRRKYLERINKLGEQGFVFTHEPLSKALERTEQSSTRQLKEAIKAFKKYTLSELKRNRYLKYVREDTGEHVSAKKGREIIRERKSQERKEQRTRFITALTQGEIAQRNFESRINELNAVSPTFVRWYYDQINNMDINDLEYYRAMLYENQDIIEDLGYAFKYTGARGDFLFRRFISRVPMLGFGFMDAATIRQIEQERDEAEEFLAWH